MDRTAIIYAPGKDDLLERKYSHLYRIRIASNTWLLIAMPVVYTTMMSRLNLMVSSRVLLRLDRWIGAGKQGSSSGVPSCCCFGQGMPETLTEI